MTHPGAHLAARIEAADLTPWMVAKRCGLRPPQVYNVISGTRRITPSLALLFGRLLDGDPVEGERPGASAWLRLQAEYDLVQAAARQRERLRAIEQCNS